MSHDASELLGDSQVAGASVKPIGSASRQAALVGPGIGGGVAAGITSRLVDGKKSKDLRISETPRFGSLGFLAVTNQELALIRVQMGVTKGKLVGVVARVPRSQVASAQVTGVWFVHMVVDFADGTRWAFEVSPQNKRQARTVASLFAANVVGAT